MPRASPQPPRIPAPPSPSFSHRAARRRGINVPTWGRPRETHSRSGAPPKGCDHRHTTLHRRPSPSRQPHCRERPPRPSGSQCPARVASVGGRPSDRVGGERHRPGARWPARHQHPPRGVGIPPRRGRATRRTGGAGRGDDASLNRRLALRCGAVTVQMTTPPRGRWHAGGRLAADHARVAGMGASLRRRIRATAAVNGGTTASSADGRPRARADAVRPIAGADARGCRHEGFRRAPTLCGGSTL